MTTIKNVYDPADATGHKAEPANPTMPATKLTGAFRHLDQRMASTRDLEVGAPHTPQSTDREPDFPAMTLVDEASEHFAPAREGVIPLDSPVATFIRTLGRWLASGHSLADEIALDASDEAITRQHETAINSDRDASPAR